MGRVIASFDDLQHGRSRALFCQYEFSFTDLFSSYEDVLGKVKAKNDFSIEAFSFENQPLNVHERYIRQTLCAAIVAYELSRSQELVFSTAVGPWMRQGRKLKRQHLIAKVMRTQEPELYEIVGTRLEMLAQDLRLHRKEYMNNFLDEFTTSQ